MRAAAEVLRSRTIGTESGRQERRHRAKKWQEDAIQCATDIGEIGEGYDQKGNAAGKVRLFVGYRPERDAEPVPADGQLGFEEADAALRDLEENSPFGLSGILRELVLNLDVPGECYLVAEGLDEKFKPLDPTLTVATATNQPRGITPVGGFAGEPDAVNHRWDVRSVVEYFTEGESEMIRAREGGKARRLSRVNYVSRIWCPSPWYSDDPISPMRWVLERCEEFLLLSRGVRARARSRIPAGLFALPQGTTLRPPTPLRDDDTDGPEMSPEELLLEVMTAPIEDEASAAALVPILAFLPQDVWKDFSRDKFVSFDRPMDKETLEERRTIREWILQSLNFPVESVTGVADLNHWNAWQVWGSQFPLYTEPTVQLAVHGLTTAFLRPMLLESEVDAAAVNNLMIWYDASALMIRPNEVKDTFSAARLGAIGYKMIRDAVGAGDDDAPTPEERQQLLEFIKGSRAAEATSDGTVVGPPAEGEVPAEPSESRAITAAADGQSLGRRLLGIDRELRARLEAASTAAMNRALERAGARIRNRSVKTAAGQIAVKDVCNRDVAAVLGQPMVAALGFGEQDLVEDEFDEFGEQFRAWVGQAQKKSLVVVASNLDQSETDELSTMQAADIESAWAWLSVELMALAVSRLYDPTPTAPPVGEFDTSLAVPTGAVREAMARAGGANGAMSATGPNGGVATGELVRLVLTRNGRQLAGWEWSWGGSPVGFEGHEQLDGVSFQTWTDEVLRVRSGDEWIGEPWYRPGDHPGCSCDFVPLYVEGDGDGDGDGEANADAGEIEAA